MMTGDWAGIGGRVDSVVQHSDCAVPVWFDVVALPYGNARTTAPAIQREVTCNPLDFDARLHEFRTAVWLSEFENAYDVATEAYDTTGHPLFRPGRVVALLGQGRIDDARLMADAELVLPRSIAGARFWMAALRGDVDAARSLMDEYRSTFGFNAIDLIYFNVLLGDRDAANATAAAVDARPFGYMLLANAVLTCICGAPFDLEVTPNFARMVGQAGLSWPPETPINWPLKSW